MRISARRHQKEYKERQDANPAPVRNRRNQSVLFATGRRTTPSSDPRDTEQQEEDVERLIDAQGGFEPGF